MMVVTGHHVAWDLESEAGVSTDAHHRDGCGCAAVSLPFPLVSQSCPVLVSTIFRSEKQLSVIATITTNIHVQH